MTFSWIYTCVHCVTRGCFRFTRCSSLGSLAITVRLINDFLNTKWCEEVEPSQFVSFINWPFFNWDGYRSFLKLVFVQHLSFHYLHDWGKCFHLHLLVCLSVFLFDCQQDYAKTTSECHWTWWGGAARALTFTLALTEVCTLQGALHVKLGYCNRIGSICGVWKPGVHQPVATKFTSITQFADKFGTEFTI